jgi:hypothetical protein
MSTQTQQPPFAIGDAVEFIPDPAPTSERVIEITWVDAPPHWQIVTEWAVAGRIQRRIADADEFRHASGSSRPSALARIARRLRAWWYRRELRWALDQFGLADLDELVIWLDQPPLSEAEVARRRRFFAWRDQVLAQRNPALLSEETLSRARFWRVVDAVMGAR